MKNQITPDEFQTVTPDGQAAPRRIATIAAARDAYKKLYDGEAVEFLRRARIKGQIDGRPPYDENRLAELGLGYTTNINFLELRAELDKKASVRFETLFEVPTYISSKLNIPADPGAVVGDHARVVDEEFTRLLKDWSGFMPLVDKVGRESDAYGLGGASFQDEWDWRPKAFNRSCFFPDPQAEMDLEKLPIFALHDKYNAGDLLRTAADEKTATAAGWNVRAIRRLLINVYVAKEKQTESQMQGNYWEEIEQRFRNNDPSIQAHEFQPVYVVHELYQEVDTGEITHLIFPQSQSPEVDAFLFEAPRRYKRMSEVIWWLPFNHGDGYLRSLRGFASYLEAHFDLSNRFFGKALDAGMTAATLLVQPRTTIDAERLMLVRAGILTVIPKELDIQQNTSFAPPIKPLIELRAVSSEIVRKNTGMYTSNPEVFMENQPERTAREVAEMSSKEARAEKADLAFQLDYFQRLYREIFRRITRPEYILASISYPGRVEALAFIRRCVERGVPLEMLLSPIWEINITSPIGGGSWGVRMDILTRMMEIRSEFDEQGRINVVRDYVATLAGYANVDRYKSQINRDKVASNEHGIATLESNDFAEGVSVPVGFDQLHAIHFSVHAQYVIGIIQAVNETGGQGMDLKKAINLLGMALPHMEVHLQRLAPDPTRKSFVEEGIKLLQLGMNVLQQLQKQVEREAAMQAKLDQDNQKKLSEADAVLRNQEIELKAMEIQKRMEVEMYKQQSMNAMRQQKTQEQMDISRERASADIQLKADRQSAELDMEAARTAAKIDLERAKKNPGETQV